MVRFVELKQIEMSFGYAFITKYSSISMQYGSIQRNVVYNTAATCT